MPSSLRVREHDEDPSKEEGDLKYHEYVVKISSLADKEGKNAQQGELLGDRVIITQVESNRRRRFQQAPLRVVQDLFLPVGYPASVNDGYLDYQFYDSLQGLSSYLRGVLCSAQVLQAAGVGKAEAKALSAAMTWALKDGVSMLGGLLFSYTTAPLFDSHVKEFRLFADLINDAGMALDMLAPYCPNLLVVASAAGLCKTLCGLSAGATKSSITCHFAMEGNMADLNAKEATQETLVSLIGMLLGIVLAHHLSVMQESGNHQLVIQMQWTIFLSLTLLHIWANWRGVRLLRLRTLNRERAEVCLSNVLDAMEAVLKRKDDDTAPLEMAVPKLPGPTELNESLWSSTRKLLWSGRLKLTACLTKIIQCDPEILTFFDLEHYVLVVNRRREILVTLLTGAQVSDQLKAFVHGMLLLRITAHQDNRVPDMPASTLAQRRNLVRLTLDCVNFSAKERKNALIPSFSQYLMSALSTKGWEVHERVYLGFPRRRSEWMAEDRKER